jgi:preprotein translocase subunit YajC
LVKKMKARTLAIGFALAVMTLVAAPRNLKAQGPDTNQAPAPAPSGPPGAQGTDHPQRQRRPGVIGKISAIQADSLSVTQQDGTQIQLKLTSATEFRKERQPAKSSDFKVGDTVVVRTDSNAQPVNGALAVMVAAVPAEFAIGGDGRPRGAGGPGMIEGTLGKDYVVGEVKSIDAPKLTVLRSDNVTQTIELNEETSLKRGRDSITMADIQAGDHIFARGTAPKDVFVPTNVNVIPPDVWKRMQGRVTEGGGARGNPTGQTPATGREPPERPN